MPAELGHRQVINHFLSSLQQFSTLRYDHISTLVDGSASEGTGNKSAAAVITTVPVLQPEVLTTIKRKGRLYGEEASDTWSALN